MRSECPVLKGLKQIFNRSSNMSIPNNPQKKVLITGIHGQDGVYLANYLLSLGYEVHGLCRSISRRVPSKHLDERVVIHVCDVSCASQVMSLIIKLCPTEIYNLAAQTHVHVSFKCPEESMSTYTGLLNILESVRVLKSLGHDCRIYQASSSEMYGNSNCETHETQNEDTPMRPESPYAVMKLAAHNLVSVYRKSYGIFCVSGILFNHESVLRGDDFVTKKICTAVRRAFVENSESTGTVTLKLGNLESRRDWGFAGEYVRAMHLMLQNTTARDFVVGTGRSHSVREFVETALSLLGKHMHWNANGGVCCCERLKIEVDKNLLRPNDLVYLRADPSEIAKQLGWKSTMKLEDIIRKMIFDEY